jgi:hypothetical protein
MGADHSEKGICGSVLKDGALLPTDDGLGAHAEELLERILREPQRPPDSSNLIRGQETLFAAYGFRGPPQRRVHLARRIIRLFAGVTVKELVTHASGSCSNPDFPLLGFNFQRAITDRARVHRKLLSSHALSSLLKEITTVRPPAPICTLV